MITFVEYYEIGIYFYNNNSVSWRWFSLGSPVKSESL